MMTHRAPPLLARRDGIGEIQRERHKFNCTVHYFRHGELRLRGVGISLRRNRHETSNMVPRGQSSTLVRILGRLQEEFFGEIYSMQRSREGALDRMFHFEMCNLARFFSEPPKMFPTARPDPVSCDPCVPFTHSLDPQGMKF